MACGKLDEPPPAKVLLVGIDGAEWSIIDRLRAEGRVPTLDRLIEQGTRGHLETITPTLSPALWTTIATGVAPGVHGIHNFVIGRPEAALILPKLPAGENLTVRIGIRLAGPCRMEDVVVMAGEEQLRSIVDADGLTTSLPAVAVSPDGATTLTLRLPYGCAPQSSGEEWPRWGALKAVVVRRPDGQIIAAPRVGSLLRPPTLNRPVGNNDRGALLLDQRFRPTKSTDRRVPALWTIATAHDRSVGVVGWWATYPAERVKGTVISDVLRSRDTRQVLQSGEALPGATSSPDWSARLVSTAFGSWDVSAEDMATFVPRGSPRFDALLDVPAHVSALDDPPLSVLKTTFLFARAYLGMARALLSESRPDLFLAYTSLVDVAEHKFWRYFEPERFENVSREEVEDFADVIPRAYVWVDRQLESMLESIDGSTVVMVVSDHGHHAAPESLVFSGHHEDGPPGILIAAGPGIRAGSQMAGATIFDIAPTVLAVMGLPVPEDFPGRVLGELFERPPTVTAVESYRDLEVQWVSESSDDDIDNSVRERLRALGYL